MLSFLSANPNVNVEIGGHTDQTGSTEYNMKLSEKRAESVFNYLVSKNTNILTCFAGFTAAETAPIIPSAMNKKAMRKRFDLFFINNV